MIDTTDSPTLNTFLALCGLCSRRKAADFIHEGVVAVDGEVITEPGYRVAPHSRVTFRGKQIQPESKVYILLNKPAGYLCTLTDPENRPHVIHLLQPTITARVYPVGRLDQETTGLLILTNDGKLSQRLAHPKHMVEKVYEVVLNRALHIEDVIKITEDGVLLDDNLFKPDKLHFISQNKRAVSLSIHSGKNRIIRRLFQACGYTVTKLDRVSYAGLTKAGLSVGKWRFLDINEIERLQGPSS